MKKKKRRNGFRIFMIVWCAVLICAGICGLKYLSGYLREYEESRPKYVLEAYSADVVSGNVPDFSFTVLDRIDERIQSRQEALAFIRGILSGAKFYKSVNESTDDILVYRIMNGNDLIGSASMTKTGETEHGFPLWSFTGEEFFLDQYLTSSSVTVPREYTVSAGGTVLGSSFITARDIEYETFRSFYGDHPDFPRMVRYEVGSVLGDMALSVTDNFGNPVSEDGMNEKSFLSTCFPCGNENEIREFTSDFIAKYSDYTSNETGYATANYSELKSIVVPESILHERIRLAFDAMGFVYSEKCDVIREDIGLICQPQEGVYLSEVSYSIRTKREHGEAVTDSSIRLIIEDYKNGLRASDMSTF